METIRRFLREYDYEYHEEDNGNLTVDCGGQDYRYWNLVKLIYGNIEEWTYELLLNIKIEIDMPFETVTFKRGDG